MRIRRGVPIAVLLLTSATAAHAQAWNYPSFQPPRLVRREFNFAVSDGGHPAGTSVLFQWREQIAAKSQLSLDLGVAESDFFFADTHFLLGGQFGHQLATASANMPFDMLLTAGVNAAIGDPFTLLRVPVGLSAGHRFNLDGGMSLTPFVHPRVSYDRCSDCDPFGGAETDIGFDFDFGVDFRFKPQLALRVSASMGGSDFFGERWADFYYDGRRGNGDSSFGLSLAWSPRGARAADAPRSRGARPAK